MSKTLIVISLLFITNVSNAFFGSCSLVDDEFKMIKCGNDYYKRSPFCTSFGWNKIDKVKLDVSGFQPALVNLDRGETCEYHKVY